MSRHLADELAGVVEMEDDVIVQIDLSDTETEDQHLKVIAEAIALEWLDLSNTRISDEGVKPTFRVGLPHGGGGS